MTRQILIVCNHGVASRYLAEELSRALEERIAEDGEEMEEFDFNPRGMLARTPTDEEIAEACAVLAPFTEKQFLALSNGMENDDVACWKRFFARAREEGKAVVAYYDFGKSAFVEPRKLVEELEAFCLEK